jgi:hypothetical protein
MSADVIAGNSNPPNDWMNNQLRQLGEEWPYVPPRILTVVPVPRSFVVWADLPRFGGEHEGDPLSDRHIIGFNLYYKQSGPNQVEVQRLVRRLYTKPDTSIKTQNDVINDFIAQEKLATEPLPPYTLMPNENPHFVTAFATDDTGTKWRLPVPGELDDLKYGREIIYIVAMVIYKDPSNDPKKVHHLPLCAYLQPPSSPPGIWHFCDAGFNKSD